MAYDFARSPAQYFVVSSSGISGTPGTLACLFKTTSTLLQVIMGVGGVSGGTVMDLRLPSGSSGALGFLTGASPFNNRANSSTNVSSSTWFHGAGYSSSLSSRSVLLNGASKGTNTGSDTSYTLNRTAIGATFYNNVAYDSLVGSVAEAAIWDVALTDEEIMSLSKGFKPPRIRPQSLVFYAPLIRNVQDLSQAGSFTTTGSPTVAVHPRVY